MKLIKLFETFSTEKMLEKKFLKGEFDNEFRQKLRTHHDFVERVSPSKDFEKEYGITGVAKDWKNPYPLTWEELENFMYIVTPELSERILDDLIQANPELAEVRTIKYSASFLDPVMGIIGGVCSSFNLEDIKNYLSHDHLIWKMPRKAKGNYIMKKDGEVDREYSQKYTQLYKQGYLIGWVTSMKTLDYIISEIKKKESN